MQGDDLSAYQALVAAAASVPRPPSTGPILKAGQTVVLSMGGSPQVLVASSNDERAQLAQTLRANDYYGVRDLVSAGNASLVPAHSHALIIGLQQVDTGPYGAAAAVYHLVGYEARLMDGPLAGSVVSVLPQFATADSTPVAPPPLPGPVVNLGSMAGFGNASGLSETAEQVLSAVAPTIAPVPTLASRSMKVGSTVHFGIQGQDFAPAGRYDFLGTFIQSVRANDVYGVAQHMSDFRIVLIRSGTAGVLLPSNSNEDILRTREVRVTEGPYSGRVEAVMWDWLY